MDRGGPLLLGRHGRPGWAPTRGRGTRGTLDAFSDAGALLDYGFTAFESHTFVRKGDAVGTLPIRGGSVPVLAAAGIRRLVPTAALADAHVGLIADPDAAFPPAPGQQVGMLRVTIPGAMVGSVPLLAGALPPPDPGCPLVGPRGGRRGAGRLSTSWAA